MSRSKLYLTAADEGASLTREEFAEAEFDESMRYERVQGRLSVMAPAGEDHVSSWEPFRDALVVYKLQHREIVHRVVTEAWIAIGGSIDRVADIAVYLKTGRGRIPQRVPELVFEIVSPGSEERDYDEKREEYAQIGVQEYVIVDRSEHRVTVLRMADGMYVESVLGPADVYTTPLLPDLEIALHGLA
jgi:Uma2 family endonuclease